MVGAAAAAWGGGFRSRSARDDDPRVRLGAQLRPERGLVGLRESQRPRPISRFGHRRHAADDDARIERVRLRRLPPPVRRGRRIAAPARHLRERLQRAEVALGQPGPLPLHPALELGDAAQEETVEERSPVDADRAREVPRLERGSELCHVHRQQLWIERQVGRAEEEALGGEVAAQAVEQLGQTVERVVGGAIRPEVSDQLVPAQPSPAGAAEQREQGEGLPLRGGALPGRLSALDREAAKRQEPHPTSA